MRELKVRMSSTRKHLSRKPILERRFVFRASVVLAVAYVLKHLVQFCGHAFLVWAKKWAVERQELVGMPTPASDSIGLLRVPRRPDHLAKLQNIMVHGRPRNLCKGAVLVPQVGSRRITLWEHRLLDTPHVALID